MRKYFLSLIIAAATLVPASLMAQGYVTIARTDNAAPVKFAIDDVMSLKFANEEMSVVFNGNASSSMAEAQTPFTIKTNNVVSIKFEPSTMGINDNVIDMGDVEPIYYNIQGIRVENPESGKFYIKVQGNKASKIKF